MSTTPTKQQRESFPAAMRRLWVAFIGEDRTQLNLPVEPSRTLRFGAWTAIISLSIIGWGSSTVAAVSIALGNEYTPTPVSDGRAVLRILLELAVAGVAWALILAMRAATRSTPAPAPWRTQLRVFPVAVAAPAAGFALYYVISWVFGLTTNGYPQVDHDTPTSFTLALATSMMAGPTEELALMALVVTALRTTGYSWTVVCITAIAVRVPFHLYYGWGAIGLSLWAVLIIALYRQTNALLAIITAHATFNALNYADVAGATIKSLLVITGVVIAFRYIWKRTQATEPSADTALMREG